MGTILRPAPSAKIKLEYPYPSPKWEIIIKDTKEKGFWRKGPLWCVS